MYIPNRGDIVYLDFDASNKLEQWRHRTALVVSPFVYNESSSLALFLPITKRQKGYPFEVSISFGLDTHGVVLADQIKCLDWKVRGVRFVAAAPARVIAEVQAKIQPLLL